MEKRVFLDVRTPDEFREGHVSGSLNMNVMEEDEFREGLEALDKQLPYTVYCRTENRSALAVDILREAGFEDVEVLRGGYRAHSRED